VSALSLGNGFGCAANPQGTWCWGRNDFGQLARPLTLKESSTALLAHPGGSRLLGTGIAALVYDGAGQLCGWGRNATKLISPVDAVDVFTQPECRALADVSDLTVGDTHACVRHGDGRFTCWGERYYGQLGLGGTDTADVPPPGMPASLAPVSALAAGVSHTCALSPAPEGSVTCFGRNDHGQIGPAATGVEEEIRVPTKVTGLSAVTGLGAGSTAQHTCAILADGAVACWGNDHAGQLGDTPAAVDPTRFSRQPVMVRF
jgi:alpha-tubulin suppressor-like RCC1 family protein